MSYRDSTYVVYKYTSPSNKSYIGITCQKKLKYRSGKNGINYRGCPLFYNAIKKYGFENFTSDILFYDLSRDEASKKEIESIRKYNTIRPYGYNIDKGGSSAYVSTKKVIVFSLEKELICYDSIVEASEKTNVNKNWIHRHIDKPDRKNGLFFMHSIDCLGNIDYKVANDIIQSFLNINRIIYVYKNRTLLFKCYDRKEVSEKTGLSRSDISLLLSDNNNRKTSKNYILSYTPLDNIDMYMHRISIIQTKSVYIYHNRNLITIVNSIPEASDYTGINSEKIRRLYDNGSLYEIKGYAFVNHVLNQKELSLIHDDRNFSKYTVYNKYTKEGDFITTYFGLDDAMKSCEGKNRSQIIRASNDPVNKTAYGYRWTRGNIINLKQILNNTK